MLVVRVTSTTTSLDVLLDSFLLWRCNSCVAITSIHWSWWVLTCGATGRSERMLSIRDHLLGHCLFPPMLKSFISSLKVKGFDLVAPFCGIYSSSLWSWVVQDYNQKVEVEHQLPVLNQKNTLALLIGIHCVCNPCHRQLSILMAHIYQGLGGSELWTQFVAESSWWVFSFFDDYSDILPYV